MIADRESSLPHQPLPWLDSFDVGDPRIDGEHRALIEVANEVCALARTAPPLPMLRTAARDLIAVTEAHFESEEALFPAIGYPDCSLHVREHLAILAELRALLLEDGRRDFAVAAGTARLLLVEHILRHDQGFSTWISIRRRQ